MTTPDSDKREWQRLHKTDAGKIQKSKPVGIKFMTVNLLQILQLEAELRNSMKSDTAQKVTVLRERDEEL